jgi:type I restriction enzyme S subunit
METTKYSLAELFDIGSGISSKPEQAGHGTPFLSFSTVFNNVFIPDELPDKMEASGSQIEACSVKAGDVFLTRTSQTIDELAMSSVALKDYPLATFSGFLKRLRPKRSGIVYPKYFAFYLRSHMFRKVIDANVVMTLRASFNEDIFGYLNVFLPPYETQQKIGDFLYDLERSKENDKEKVNILLSLAQTTFDFWFLLSNYPDEKDQPFSFFGGKTVNEKTIGFPIPENWRVKTLFSNEYTKIIQPGVSKFVKKNYLTTSNVNSTDIVDGGDITFENREARANMQPLLYSVWFAKMKSSVKKVFVPKNGQWIIDKYILSTGFSGIECAPIFFPYLACFINSNYFLAAHESVADVY